MFIQLLWTTSNDTVQQNMRGLFQTIIWGLVLTAPLGFSQDGWLRAMIDGNPIAAMNKSSDYNLLQNVRDQDSFGYLTGEGEIPVSQPGYYDGFKYELLPIELIEEKYSDLQENETRLLHVRKQIANLIQNDNPDDDEALIIFTGLFHAFDYFEYSLAKKLRKQVIYLTPRVTEETLLYSESARRFYQDVLMKKRDELLGRQALLAKHRFFYLLRNDAKYSFRYSLMDSLSAEVLLFVSLYNFPNLRFDSLLKAIPIQHSAKTPFIVGDNHYLSALDHIYTGLPSVSEMESKKIKKVTWGLEGIGSEESYGLDEVVSQRHFDFSQDFPRIQKVMNEEIRLKKIIRHPGFYAVAERMIQYHNAGIPIEIKGIDHKTRFKF